MKSKIKVRTKGIRLKYKCIIHLVRLKVQISNGRKVQAEA